MNTIIVKTNDATQTVAQVQVVTKDGKPTIIKAMDKVNYEFHDAAIGRAPNHIITKRLKNDLHISFEEDGKESDLIIEGFYDEADSALLGIAEDGEYYYYIPDTGETYDYVTQLETGDVEGQALGGTEYIAAAIPWWIPAAAGLGLAGLVLGLSSGGGDDKTPVNREPTATNDTVLGETGQPVIIDVVANDKDPENDLDPTSVKLIDPVTGDEVPILVIDGEGEWSVNATTGEVTFTPETGFTADPTPVNYIVSDKNGEKSNEATITVDYPGIVSISGIASLNETTADGSANEATYTVSISNPSTEDTVVTVVISNGTTEGSEDYTAPVTQDVTIPAGQTSVDFTVTMVDDSVFEGPEDFNVTVSAVTVGAATIDANKDSVTTTIYDDGTTDGSTPVNPADPSVGGDKPVVSIAATVDKAVEGEAAANILVFIVSQNNVSNFDTDVSVSLGTNNAVDAADIDQISYTVDGSTDVVITDPVAIAAFLATGSVTIPAGSTFTPVITVTAKDDTTFENSESLVLDISTDTDFASVSTANGSATGTILDEDQADNSVDNPNNPDDPDDTTDGDKPTVTVDNASVTEGGDLVHTVTVNGVTETPVTYPFSLTNGSTNPAEAGTDYSNTAADIDFSNGVVLNNNGTITVPAGVTDFTVTYPTTVDAILENDETTTLTIGNDSGTGTITDAANATPVVSIAATDPQAVEGKGDDTIIFTVSQTGNTVLDSSVTATLNLGVIDATDIDSITLTDTTGNAVSYTVAEVEAGISVSIPAGATNMPFFTITPTDDAIYEVSENFGMTISGPNNATIGTNSATGTILDEDQADNSVDNPNNPDDPNDTTDGDKPTVTVDNASVTEGGDLVHTVTVNGVTETPVTYPFSLTNGSTNPAEAGTDYSNTAADIDFSNGVVLNNNGTITVPAGVTDFTVTYPTTVDAILENDETTTLTIGNDSGTGTIIDNDVAPTIDIGDEDAGLTPADNSVTEGTSATILGTINITNPQSVTALTVGGENVINATSTTPVIIPNGIYGALVITNYNATTGELTYSYTENNDPKNHNSAGDNIVDTFTVALTDTIGGTKNETLDIQIIDTAPTANPDTNAIIEDVNVDGSDKITATGNVLTANNAAATDVADTLGADATTVTAVTGTAAGIIGGDTTGDYGTLKLNEDGTYTYVVDNTAAYVQSLAKGEKLIETFNYTITDADGDESSTTLTITITGTNNRPTITNVADVIETVAITEQTDKIDITQTGNISFADTDSTDALTLSYVEGSNTYDFTGNSALISLTDEQKLAIDKLFSINQTDKNTGTWDITAASNAIDFIPAGETITIRYAVQVDDNEGVTAVADGNELSASETRYVEVTITGTGDGIALVDDIKTVNEDVTLTGNIFDNDTNDPDVGETLIVESYEVNGTTISVTAGTSSATAVTIDGNTIGQLTVNSDGSYTFVPTSNYSGTVPTITANVSNGLSVGDADRSAGSETLDITVTPVSDRPTLSSVSVTTNEDTTVALGLTAPSISDSTDLTNNTDDSSERIGLITLRSVPTGVTLNYGSSSITASGGNITILLSDANVISSPGTPTITMTTAEFEAMTLTPPTDSAANISIVMAVTEYEVDSTGTRISGVSGATSTTTIKVDVQAVTDSSNNNGTGDDVSTFGYTAVVGDTGVVSGSTYTVSAEEGEYIDLPITTAFGDLVSTGNSSTETYGFVINNLVEGTVIEFTPAGGGAVQTFTAGIDGKVLIGIDAGLTDADLLVNGGSEPKIRIQTNEFNSQDMNGITVSLYTQDHDTDSTPEDKTVELISTVTVDMTVTPVAGQVELDNTGVQTEEDTPVTLDKFGFTVLDTQDDSGSGAETITEIEFTLPEGWTYNDGSTDTVGASGGTTITITDTSNLSGLSLTPPAQSSTDTDFTFTVTTEDTDDDGSNTVSSTTTLDQTVTITPVAEVVGSDIDGDGTIDLTINTDHVYTAAAQEDAAFNLGTDGAFNLIDGWSNQDDSIDFGTESHTTDANDSEQTEAHLTFGNKDGSTFTAIEGAVFTYIDSAGVTVSLTDSGSGVDIPAAYLNSVTVTPPDDYSEYNVASSATTAVKVEAVTTDYDEDTGSSVTTTSGESYLTFTVEGVADITTLGVDPATGFEDQALASGNMRATAADMGDVTTGTIGSDVTPENGIKLQIRPSSRDDDGSEVYNVTIDDIPAGAQLYVDDNGTVTLLDTSSGSVTISDYNNVVDNLYFVSAENFGGTVNLKVSAVSEESDGNISAPSAVLNLPIRVFGQADLILNDELATVDVNGTAYTYTIAEDVLDSSNLIALSEFFSDAAAITPYDVDIPATEQVTYKVTGVPIGFDITGAVFLGGSGETRSWSVSLESLQDGSAQLVTPDNFAGEVDFTITGTTTETVSGNSATHDTQTVSLVVTPDAADGVVNDPQVLAVEDTWTTVNFVAAFSSGDTTAPANIATGYEALETITIKSNDLMDQNVALRVDGAEVTLVADQTYTYNANQTIEIMYDDDKRHSDDDVTIPFDYTYTDTASLTDDSTISSTSQTGSANIDVTFQAVTDAPSIELDVTDNTIVISSANDNNSASVIVSLSSDDQDDSESFTRLEITDVPAGIIVEGGILSGGTWYVDVPDTAITDTASTYTLVLTRDPNTADTPTGNIPVTVTGITQDINGEGLNGSEARVSDSFIINLSRDGTGENPIDPELIATLETKPPLSQTEDGAFKLSDVINAELETGTASTVSSYSFSLTDLPEGVLLNSTNSAVTVQQIGGQWLVSVDNANGLTPNEALAAVTLTPPADFSTNDNSDTSQNLNFGVEFTALNNVGLETSEDMNVSVEIKPVTDFFDNNLETTVLATNEDTTVAININLTNSADGDYVSIIDGKLYLQLDEDGLTDDRGTTGVLTDDNGVALVAVTLATGEVGSIPAGTYYVVDVADTDPAIEGVNPADSITVNYTPAANEDGTAVVKVYTTHTEASNISDHDSGTLTYEHSYDITVAAQPDNLSIAYDDVVAKATGDEDTKIAIDYKINVVDENDTAAAITFDEVPNGYLVYYTNKSGVVVLASNNGDSDGNGNNSWSIDTNKLENVNSGAAGETNNIFIAPPENISGVVENIEMTVVNNSGMASAPLVIDLDVTPVADEIVFNPSTLLGSQGKWTTLNLNAAMVDVDGSETVNIIVTGDSLYGDVLQVETRDGAPLNVRWDLDTKTYVIEGVPYDSINNIRIKSATPYTGPLSITLETVEKVDNVIVDRLKTDTGTIQIDVKPTLVFNGTDGDDELISVNQTAALKYSGGAGNDTFIGGSGNDTLNGDAGNDTLTGGAGNDTINGGADDDTIDGGAGVDTLNGGTGNDTLIFDAADLVINGGDGIDTLLINEENTTINFGTFDSSKFESIEVIDMTGNGAQSLTNLSTSDVLDIINDTVMTDKDLIINGDSDDSVSLTATGWTNSGTTTQDGINYNVYSFSDTNGNHDLLIQTDVNTTIL